MWKYWKRYMGLSLLLPELAVSSRGFCMLLRSWIVYSFMGILNFDSADLYKNALQIFRSEMFVSYLGQVYTFWQKQIHNHSSCSVDLFLNFVSKKKGRKPKNVLFILDVYGRRTIPDQECCVYIVLESRCFCFRFAAMATHCWYLCKHERSYISDVSAVDNMGLTVGSWSEGPRAEIRGLTLSFLPHNDSFSGLHA